MIEYNKKCNGTIDFTALVNRAKNGDKDAFSVLYEATNKEVFRAIRAMVTTEDEALDIQQDTYVQAFTNLNQLSEPEKFRGWIRTIAVNQTRQALRKWSPFLFSELGEEDEDFLQELPDDSPASSPELVLEQKESAAYIREILESLSPGQRMMVGMFYYQQLPMAEIAKSLDLNVGTVKSQLFRARKKIEEAVTQLQRSGVKLYGLAPLPFLVALFEQQNPASAAGKAVLTKALEASGVSLGAKAAAAGAAPVAETVGLHVGRRFFETAAGKLVLGVLVAGIIGGGAVGYGWYREYRDKKVSLDDYPVIPITTTDTDCVQTTGATVEEPDYEALEELSYNPRDELDWSFDRETGVLTITGTGRMRDYSIDAQNLYPEWYEYREEIKEVVLPEGLTNIGAEAFEDCTALRRVNLPESLRVIHHYAFCNCTQLREISLPESLITICPGAFKGCERLKYPELPKNLKKIGYEAFMGCPPETDMIIPGSVACIEARALGYQLLGTKVMNLTLYSTERSVVRAYAQENGFRYQLLGYEGAKPEKMIEPEKASAGSCGDGLTWRVSTGTGLLEINGSGRMTDFPAYGSPWYEYRDSITALSLPEGLTYIGSNAFASCTALTEVRLPETLTEIADSAFANCSGLQQIPLPENLTSVGRNAFRFCSGLERITLPENMTAIPAGMFSACVSLERVDFPDALTEIGHGAFDNCPNLTAVTVPASVREIGDRAFGYDEVSNENPEGKIEGFTIYGKQGSAAQTYAQENGFPFEIGKN